MNKDYKEEEVYAATLEYFDGDDLATRVWIDKYSLKNDGKFFELTPLAMHKRIAKEFARIEQKYPNPMSEDEILQLLKDFKYVVPQGSPMAGIGNPFATTSISNCFVVGNHVDSYGGIFRADEEQAQLMKRRGGVGQDLSWLRPSGAIAGTTPLGENAGTTLYMDRYSNTTREVQQDGRRGALMLSIADKHPDAEKFVDKKMTPGAVTGANVSVKLSDEFMTSLKEERDFYQIFPIKRNIDEVVITPSKDQNGIFVDLDMILESLEYDKLYTGKVINNVQTYFKKVDPSKIFDKLVFNAWKAAEPGALFFDKILNESPAKGYGDDWKEISTNPCGEIPLPDADSCRLLVLNLYSYAFRAFKDDSMLEDTLLTDHVKKAQRLMDDIVDLEIEKIDAIIESIERKEHPDTFQFNELNLWKRIKKKAIQGRRTGLGITGEGDLVAALGYVYGTPEATEFSKVLHQLIATAAYESSIELAEERGCFPLWSLDQDSESEFLKRMFGNGNELMDEDIFEKYTIYGRRNIAVLTIAPTGSVSILTQTSSGIEPVFACWYFRKKKITNEKHWDYVDEVGDKWVEFPVFHRQFISWFAASSNMDFNIAKYHLETTTKEHLQKLFESSPYYGATAQDVDYVEKVRMQGAVQQWIDHSISVTVNMPEHVTVETVKEVYWEAYKSGCKGVTVYRDNSRGNVLSTTSVKDVKEEEEDSKFKHSSAVKRPAKLKCDIFFKTKAGTDFIGLVGLMEDKPYEIFLIPAATINLSKTHKTGEIFKTARGKYHLIGENDMPLIDDISSFMIESEQNSTRNFSAMLRHGMAAEFIVEIISKYASISSFHKVVGSILKTYTEEGKETGCEKCGGKIVKTEGCEKCVDCGHAKCG